MADDQDLRERFLVHTTQSKERWEEQWRRNESLCERLDEAEERMTEMEQAASKFREGYAGFTGELRGQVRLGALVGSVIGGGIVTVIAGFVLWIITGGHK